MRILCAKNVHSSAQISTLIYNVKHLRVKAQKFLILHNVFVAYFET